MGIKYKRHDLGVQTEAAIQAGQFSMFVGQKFNLPGLVEIWNETTGEKVAKYRSLTKGFTKSLDEKTGIVTVTLQGTTIGGINIVPEVDELILIEKSRSGISEAAFEQEMATVAETSVAEIGQGKGGGKFIGLDGVYNKPTKGNFFCFVALQDNTTFNENGTSVDAGDSPPSSLVLNIGQHLYLPFNKIQLASGAGIGYQVEGKAGAVAVGS